MTDNFEVPKPSDEYLAAKAAYDALEHDAREFWLAMDRTRLGSPSR